jgi:hypothetical protein
VLVLLAWLCLRRRREWRECREHWDRNGDVEGAGAGAPILCVMSGRAGLVAIVLWLAVQGLMAVVLWLAVLWLAVRVAGRAGAVAARGAVWAAGGGILGVRPPMSWGLSTLAVASALAIMVRSVESWALIAGTREGGGPGGGGGGGGGSAAWLGAQLPMFTLTHTGCTCGGGGGGGCAAAVSGVVVHGACGRGDRERVCERWCEVARAVDSLGLQGESESALSVGEIGNLTEASPKSLTVRPRLFL